MKKYFIISIIALFIIFQNNLIFTSESDSKLEHSIATNQYDINIALQSVIKQQEKSKQLISELQKHNLIPTTQEPIPPNKQDDWIEIYKFATQLITYNTMLKNQLIQYTTIKPATALPCNKASNKHHIIKKKVPIPIFQDLDDNSDKEKEEEKNELNEPQKIDQYFPKKTMQKIIPQSPPSYHIARNLYNHLNGNPVQKIYFPSYLAWLKHILTRPWYKWRFLQEYQKLNGQLNHHPEKNIDLVPLEKIMLAMYANNKNDVQEVLDHSQNVFIYKDSTMEHSFISQFPNNQTLINIQQNKGVFNIHLQKYTQAFSGNLMVKKEDINTIKPKHFDLPDIIDQDEDIDKEIVVEASKKLTKHEQNDHLYIKRTIGSAFLGLTVFGTYKLYSHFSSYLF